MTSTPAKRQRRGSTVKKKVVARPVKVRLGKQPFPKQITNTLRYTDVAFITTASGWGKIRYIANGLYDPDYDYVGHQPMFFDQLTALYNHFTVLRSRIKVTFTSPSTFAHLFVVYLDDDTTTASTAQIASEQPGARVYYGKPNNISGPSLTNSYDAVKIFGPNPQGNPNLIGTAAANPTETQVYNISVYDQAVGTNTIDCFVELEYDVVWDELKTQASS